MNKYQETCFCNEPCFYYVNLKRSNSGNSLIKCMINKCSKNSKKSVCEYVSEKFLEQEEMPEVVDKQKEVNTKKYKSEFEKIKTEILETINLYELQEKYNTNSDNSKAKIIAYCYRINIIAIGLCKDNIDFLRSKVQNKCFIPIIEKQTRIVKNIELVSSSEFPFLNVKNTTNTKKKTSKTRENTKKLAAFIRKFDFTDTEEIDTTNQDILNDEPEIEIGEIAQDEENEEEIEIPDEIEEDAVSEFESDDGGDYGDYD